MGEKLLADYTRLITAWGRPGRWGGGGGGVVSDLVKVGSTNVSVPMSGMFHSAPNDMGRLEYNKTSHAFMYLHTINLKHVYTTGTLGAFSQLPFQEWFQFLFG